MNACTRTALPEPEATATETPTVKDVEESGVDSFVITDDEETSSIAPDNQRQEHKQQEEYIRRCTWILGALCCLTLCVYLPVYIVYAAKYHEEDLRAKRIMIAGYTLLSTWLLLSLCCCILQVSRLLR